MGHLLPCDAMTDAAPIKTAEADSTTSASPSFAKPLVAALLIHLVILGTIGLQAAFESAPAGEVPLLLDEAQATWSYFVLVAAGLVGVINYLFHPRSEQALKWVSGLACVASLPALRFEPRWVAISASLLAIGCLTVALTRIRSHPRK